MYIRSSGGNRGSSLEAEAETEAAASLGVRMVSESELDKLFLSNNHAKQESGLSTIAERAGASHAAVLSTKSGLPCPRFDAAAHHFGTGAGISAA
jgi:hypothetical protein